MMAQTQKNLDILKYFVPMTKEEYETLPRGLALKWGMLERWVRWYLEAVEGCVDEKTTAKQLENMKFNSKTMAEIDAAQLETMIKNLQRRHAKNLLRKVAKLREEIKEAEKEFDVIFWEERDHNFFYSEKVTITRSDLYKKAFPERWSF